ncbi:MAG: protease complex subunit PrcB family protein [Dehalococcoidia bacterium]
MRLTSAIAAAALLTAIFVSIGVASHPVFTQVTSTGNREGQAGPLGDAGDAEPLMGDEQGQGPGSPAGDTEESGAASTLLETIWLSDFPSFGFQEPAYLVIQNEDDWLALWQRAAALELTPPSVDFETQTVLVAALGRVPSTGYTIQIKSVVPDETGGHLVSVEISLPGKDCVVGPAFTDPVHMVSIPKSDGPFQFETQQVVYACS